jgi:FAD/FMN-containing dehydrogenase
MSTIDQSELAAFHASFDGLVLAPGDDQYDHARARAIWNGDIDRRPAVIVQPSTPQQVAAAIRFGRDQGLDLTVRGGGHSFAGHAISDGGLMIDLGGMNEVSVDLAQRRARCGGGATWAQFDGATSPHGLAVTGGVVSHTGVAGLTLGGGLGWLTRRSGLSCDSLVSIELVTADGRIVTAAPDENADLFWALRGGGGNFGVVTSFEFGLHEIAPMANVGLLFWAVQDARNPLRLARELIHEVPHEFGAQVIGMSAPPAPFVPAEHHGVPGVAVVIANWESAEDHARAIAPLRALKPLFEFVSPIPYVGLQQMVDNSAPWGFHGYEKALYFDELSDKVIDIGLEYLPRKASPLSITPIFPLGGAYAEVGDDETAFGGSRQTRWAYNISALAPTADMLAQDRAWVSDFWAALRPHSRNGGTYVNFLSDADADRVRASYGAAKYDRLAAIKATWDPDNVFHHNANIKPLAVSRD